MQSTSVNHNTAPRQMKTQSPSVSTLDRLNSPNGHATIGILTLIACLLGFILVGCAGDGNCKSNTTVYRESGGHHGAYFGTGQQQSSQFSQTPQASPNNAGQQQLPPPQFPSPAPQQAIQPTAGPGELQHIHMSQNVRVTNSPPALISIPPTSSSNSTYQHPGNTANGGGVIVVVNVTNNNVNNVYQPVTSSRNPQERPSTALIFHPFPAGTLPRATHPATTRSSRTNAPASSRTNAPPPTAAPTTP